MSHAQEEGRFHAGYVASIAAGHAVHDTYTAFLPPLLPWFIRKLLLSKTEAGALSVFLTLPTLFQPMIGRLADRTGLRYAVVAAPSATAAMMCLLGIAPAYGALVLFLVLAGISNTAFHAVAPAMIGALSGRRIGRGMGFWMLGGELGRTLGPIVVVSVVGVVSLSGMPWLMAGGFLASFVLYLCLRHVEERQEGQARGLASWRSVLRDMRPVMVPLAGVITVRAFMLSSLTLYLPTFLTEQGVGLWSAGAALTVLEAAGVAGALSGGWVSDRLGRKRVISASLLATPVLMFAFLLADGWLRFSLLPLLGFVGLCTGPVVMAVVLENFPEHRAFANGIYMLMASAIRSVAVLIIGATGDIWGLWLTFAGCAALMFLGSPLVRLLPEKQVATDRR